MWEWRHRTLRFPRVKAHGIRLTSLDGSDQSWDDIMTSDAFEQIIYSEPTQLYRLATRSCRCWDSRVNSPVNLTHAYFPLALSTGKNDSSKHLASAMGGDVRTTFDERKRKRGGGVGGRAGTGSLGIAARHQVIG